MGSRRAAVLPRTPSHNSVDEGRGCNTTREVSHCYSGRTDHTFPREDTAWHTEKGEKTGNRLRSRQGLGGLQKRPRTLDCKMGEPVDERRRCASSSFVHRFSHL